MDSRRQFLAKGGLGFLTCMRDFNTTTSDFEGLVIDDQEGEAYMNGKTITRIKIAKVHGCQSMSFLSSQIIHGHSITVHKHLNEDEFIFIHKGSGVLTLGEEQYPVSTGAVAMVPKGVWHGLQNIGNENIEMRFGYAPSGFEGYFREVGIPLGQTGVEKTPEERRAIGEKWGMLRKM